MAWASVVSAQLPGYTPNAPSYINECDANNGWMTANGTLTATDGVLLLKPSGANEATAQQSVAMPVPMKDWSMQALVRASYGHKQSIQIIETGAYQRKLFIYLNYNSTTNTIAPGTISLRRTNNVGANANKVCFTGVNTEEPLLLNMSFDSRNASVTVRMKDAYGWKFGAQVGASWHQGDIVLATQGTGSFIAMDYVQVASPDIQAIGDSNCNGATTFSTVISANKNDGNNQWHRWCDAYPDMRNTLIVNKGVNGNTSAAVLARLQADVIDNAPRVVFLHSCNNDYTQGVPLATRLSNIQASINLLNAAGIKVVLLNALYGTAARPSNPAEKAYYEQAWNQGLATWSGYHAAIDITGAVIGPDGFQDPSLTNATDGLHLNNAGAQAVGSFIAP